MMLIRNGSLANIFHREFLLTGKLQEDAMNNIRLLVKKLLIQ